MHQRAAAAREWLRAHSAAGLCAALLGALSGLGGCAPAGAPQGTTQQREPVLPLQDVRFVDRVTYGIDSASLEAYARLGRSGFLRQQLTARAGALPEPLERQLSGSGGGARWAQLEHVAAENRRIRDLPEAERQEARHKLDAEGNEALFQAQRAHLLRALYSPNQLQEQMVWFWENHFSVFAPKGNVRWLVADYEDQAIRPHALGHFRDLVMATLTHPAMLQYLDNAQNAVGHLNENYARELMELHTLGVDGGYTQQDVQELARILTGVGIRYDDQRPRLRREWQRLYVRHDGFEFNPARHDFASKTLLGRHIAGGGFTEVQQAVDLLVRQPACARHVSRQIARYFLGTEPPPALLAELTRVFLRSDGDTRAVLAALFASPELAASLGSELKDPNHFVISALRLAYDGQLLADAHPIVQWLNTLGELPFAHQTPDGYALGASGWSSSGQLARRFEVARRIGAGGALPPSAAAGRARPPALESGLYTAALQPRLSAGTQAVLAQARNPREWNLLLLASPEFNYR